MLLTALIVSTASLLPAQISEDFGIYNPDPGYRFHFGNDVAVRGDTLVVGAHHDEEIA
ncbi:MAG: hypothetical protein HQ519_16075 [Planctomycetes bacterium]|nr:hypothetical protein [Planctomycetota bacterium]